MPLGLRLETAFGEPRGSFVLFVLCAPAAHRPVSAWSGAGILLTDRVKKADAPVVAYRGDAFERIPLLTQVQLFEDRLVTSQCSALQVIQMAATTRDHAEQTTT